MRASWWWHTKSTVIPKKAVTTETTPFAWQYTFQFLETKIYYWMAIRIPSLNIAFTVSNSRMDLQVRWPQPVPQWWYISPRSHLIAAWLLLGITCHIHILNYIDLPVHSSFFMQESLWRIKPSLQKHPLLQFTLQCLSLMPFCSHVSGQFGPHSR